METRPVPPLAVLFDYDGTLVDTEPYWMQGEIDMMAAMGVAWTQEQASQLCGTSREYSQSVQLAHLAANGIDVARLDVDDLYRELCGRVIAAVHDRGLVWLPGARELLLDLQANGIPAAVVSNSPADVLAAGLEQFPPGAIACVVDGDATSNGKPDPEGYHAAAASLGVAAPDCIVVEDSVSGAAAGREAGAVVLAVPGFHPIPAAPGQIKLPGLGGVDVARLRALFAQVRG